MTPRRISKMVEGFLTEPKTNQASKASRASSVLQSLGPGQFEKLSRETQFNLQFWAGLSSFVPEQDQS